MFIRKLVIDALAFPGVKDSHIHTGFYPSSASVEYTDDEGTVLHVGTCLRQQFYSHAGVPRTEEMDSEVLVKLELGNWTHEMIVELVKRSGYWLGDERRMFIEGPPPVSGRADLFVKDPRDGSPVGCEIKSISGYYGVKRQIKDTDARPKMEAVLQCVPYLDFYGAWGLTKWIILYVDRESGAMAEYVVMLEEDGSVNVQGENFAEIYHHINLHEVRRRWNQLSGYIAKGELPPRDYVEQWSNKEILRRKNAGELTATETKTIDSKLKTGNTNKPMLKKGDWQCNYCDWKRRCPNDEAGPFEGEVSQMIKPVALSPAEVARMQAAPGKPKVDKIDQGEVF